MNEVVTQAHVIKLECKECEGTARKLFDPDFPDVAPPPFQKCLHCTNGKRECLAFPPILELSTIGCHGKLGMVKPGPKWGNRWKDVNDLSPYKKGDTVPTPDGQRIAGTIELKKAGDVLQPHTWPENWYPRYGNDVKFDTYLCIAESKPV